MASDDLTGIFLFSGVGGIELAAERAGIKPLAAVEIDKAARRVLARHFPDTRIYEDVTRVHSPATCSGCDNCLPATRVSLVGAGWPCQDLSVAGRRLGLAGKRSGLWWEVVRLLAELSPRWFFGENVPGLLSACCPCPGDGSCGAAGPVCPGEPHPVPGGTCPGGCMAAHGGAMGAVVGSLGELGYGHAYRVLDAQFCGVPQRRRRVFIVGCLGEWTAPAEVLFDPQGSSRNPATSRPQGQGVAGTLGGGSGSRGWSPDTDRMTFVPVAAATLTAGTSSPGVSAPGRRQEDDENLVVTHTLTAEGFDASEDGTGRGTPLVTYRKAARAQTSQDDESWVPDSIANTLNTFDIGDTRAVDLVVSEDIEVRRLTPLECERLQGYDDGWTEGQADGPRYKQMGNSVAVPAVERRIVAVDSRLPQIPRDGTVLHQHVQSVHEVRGEAVVAEIPSNLAGVGPERIGDADVA